ncbi:MAG: cobalamin-binding protein, partial [Bradymonadaceae bacterium]
MDNQTKFQRRDRPERIVCLTEDPTEILYALGEGDRVVGISAFTERPVEAKDKPVVSAFIGGSIDKIKKLEPDLVIGFSDIQGDLAQELVEANLQVLIFNQRSIQEILDVVTMLGRMVGAEDRAAELVDEYIEGLEAAAAETADVPESERPTVYFEEWNDPQICGIRWVGELVELAGGRNVFANQSLGKQAEDRFVSHEEVAAADPDAIVASWCGEPVDKRDFAERPGFDEITAVQNGDIYEIDSTIILQPGPAALTDGLDRLESILRPLAGS